MENIWEASSRVGARINARGRLFFRTVVVESNSWDLRDWMMGRRYASVLPDPVAAANVMDCILV